MRKSCIHQKMRKGCRNEPGSVWRSLLEKKKKKKKNCFKNLRGVATTPLLWRTRVKGPILSSIFPNEMKLAKYIHFIKRKVGLMSVTTDQ